MNDHVVYSLPLELITRRILLKVKSGLELAVGSWATLDSLWHCVHTEMRAAI